MRPKVYLVYYLVICSFIIVTAYRSLGPLTPDEYYQIVEFASYKLGITPAADLAWEFSAKIRPWFQPYVTLVPMWIGESLGLKHFTIYFILRCLYAFFMLASVSYFLKYRSFFFDRSTRPYLDFFWVFPFTIFFAVRTSSECFAASWAFIALGLIGSHARRPDTAKVFAIGLCLGLSHLARAHAAVFYMTFALWKLVIDNRNFSREMLASGSGFAAALVLGLILDRFGYGEWVITIYKYFTVNILDGVASSYGVHPWYYYLEQFLSGSLLQPFGGLLFALLVIFCIRRPKHLLTWWSISFSLFHCLFAHKEQRFLIPVFLFLPFIAIDSLLFLKSKVSRLRFGRFAFNFLFAIFVAGNAIFFLRRNFTVLRENFFVLEQLAKLSQETPVQKICGIAPDTKHPFVFCHLKMTYLSQDVRAKDIVPPAQCSESEAAVIYKEDELPPPEAGNNVCSIVHAEPWWSYFLQEKLHLDPSPIASLMRKEKLFRVWVCLARDEPGKL